MIVIDPNGPPLEETSYSLALKDIAAKDAEIVKLRKELEEANEAVIAAQMLGFEKGKDAAKAELAEARGHIKSLLGVVHGAWNPEIPEAALAFLAAKETQG